MSIRINSTPFSFRSFGGKEPTGEQVREELEKSFNYTQKALSNLQFTDVGGTITEGQAPFVTAGFSSIRTELVEGDSANAERIDTLEARVNDPATGLAAAFGRITLIQRASATRNTAFAQQISIVQAQVGQSQASITEERTARISADGTITASLTTEVLARQTGDVTLQANITTEATARISADGVITANLTTEVAARVGGDAANAASIVTEAIARATADGNLSANYSITVTAGSVVTGMQLNSSVGGGTTSSTIDFQGTNFRIWDGTSAYPIFSTSPGIVTLANTLVVNTSGKVYIGTGTYGATNTSFFVDNLGRMSLKDQFKWDGTTLDVARISAINGTIGGFTIGSTDITSTNIAISSSGPYVRVGTVSNERAIMELITGRSRFATYNGPGVATITAQGNDGAGLDNGLIQLRVGSTNAVSMALSSSGKISLADGSAANPSYAFLSDSDTGFYWSASGQFNVASNGSATVAFTSSRISFFVPIKLDNSYAVGAVIPTGTLTLQDSTGTTYRIPCLI